MGQRRFKTTVLVAMLVAPGMSAAAGSDSQFYVAAAQDGMAEIELGKIAVAKATTDPVRSFGSQMVADHSKAGIRLKDIAEKNGVALPQDTTLEQKALKKEMDDLKGPEFDAAYLESQIRDHERALVLLKREIANGSDPDARTWAQEMLPTVTTHLATVRKLAANDRSAR